MEAAGFERFSVFGYSFTGAFAPRLAHLTGRVDAVVSGGFPIAGDYSPLYPEIQARAQREDGAYRSVPAGEREPVRWQGFRGTGPTPDTRAHSSVVEHSPYKRGVTGSNPVAPTFFEYSSWSNRLGR